MGTRRYNFYHHHHHHNGPNFDPERHNAQRYRRMDGESKS